MPRENTPQYRCQLATGSATIAADEAFLRAVWDRHRPLALGYTDLPPSGIAHIHDLDAQGQLR
jgi:hypothetical protein